MAFLLSVFLGLFDCAFPCCGTLGPCKPTTSALAGWVQGRVLLCCVKKGMTKDQVDQLLGTPRSGWGHSDGSGFEYSYDPYGVSVDFDSRDNVIRCGVYRVLRLRD